MDYVNERRENESSGGELVVVLFYHSSSSWTTVFCGNVLELINKSKLLDEMDEFVEWQDVEDNVGGEVQVEVFIEKSILPELSNPEFLIDGAIGTMSNDRKMGMLLLRDPSKDVYG